MITINTDHRVAFHKMTISRYPISIGRYTMIKHTSEHLNKPNPKRFATALSYNETCPLECVIYMCVYVCMCVVVVGVKVFI